MRRLGSVAAAAFCIFLASPAISDEIVTLNYIRNGGSAAVSQSYVLISDDDPALNLPGAKATLLLFVGGAGRLGVADGQLGVNSNNFLTRTRHLFAASGPFNVALMDAASDFLALASGLRGQRLTAAYLEDMQNVVENLRNKFPGLPVYAVGTSRGTIAAAQFAASLSPAAGGPDGIVLTSSVTQPSGGGDHISLAAPFTIDLSAINVPALVVAHAADGCFVTPPEDAPVLVGLLKNSAPEAKLMTFSGGLPALSGPCDALSEHGYFGIETKTVNKIAEWIDKQVE